MPAMNKIRRLSQLQKERQRLAIERVELEHHIRSDWQGIRRSIAPATFARHLMKFGVDWVRDNWLKRKSGNR
jgi:hypothetical protein